LQKISLFAIHKEKVDDYTPLEKHFGKLIGRFADFKDHSIYNKKIDQAQKQNPQIAQEAYSDAFDAYLNGYNIILDPLGKSVDSHAFSKILECSEPINFFIGGAFGFSDNFKAKANLKVNLGTLTMNHRLAKVMLIEQIYRGFTIINNHPYHK
jgi:23S rRNA (pseudouridine1915-N3)-methyltransferase